MTVSLTVDCDSAEYDEIQATAIVSCVIVPVTMVAAFYTVLIPAAPFIEARTKRSGVSPLIDFMIAKWKPDKWHFSFFDIVR